MKKKSVTGFLAFSVLAAICITGCGAGGTPPDGPAVSNPAETSFDVKNSCSQASSVDVKFFDETNGDVWPSSSTVYVLNDGDEQTYKLKCNQGDNICFGASLSTNADYYWGVGISGTQGCADCCTSCGNDFPAVNLVCQ